MTAPLRRETANQRADREEGEFWKRLFTELGCPWRHRPELWSQPVGGTLPKVRDPSRPRGYFD